MSLESGVSSVKLTSCPGMHVSSVNPVLKNCETASFSEHSPKEAVSSEPRPESGDPRDIGTSESRSSSGTRNWLQLKSTTSSITPAGGDGTRGWQGLSLTSSVTRRGAITACRAVGRGAMGRGQSVTVGRGATKEGVGRARRVFLTDELLRIAT